MCYVSSVAVFMIALHYILSCLGFFRCKSSCQRVCESLLAHTHNECSRGSPKAEVAPVCQASPELFSLGRVKVNFFSVLCTLYSVISTVLVDMLSAVNEHQGLWPERTKGVANPCLNTIGFQIRWDEVLSFRSRSGEISKTEYWGTLNFLYFTPFS